MYSVICGRIQVRQLVSGLRGERDDTGRRYCGIEVDAELVPLCQRAWPPFQGSRSLAPTDAPPDRSAELTAAPRSDARRATRPWSDLITLA